MAWKDDVTLISRKEIGLDDLLQPIFEEKREEIFCNKRDLTRSEFYLAAQTTFRPSLILEVHIFEYDNQEFLEFENQLYKVIKTYEPRHNILELTCEAVIEEVEHGNGSSEPDSSSFD